MLEEGVRVPLAMKLFDGGAVGLRQGAKLADMSLSEFMAECSARDVPWCAIRREIRRAYSRSHGWLGLSDAGEGPNPEREVRLRCRDLFRETLLLERIIPGIEGMLSADEQTSRPINACRAIENQERHSDRRRLGRSGVFAPSPRQLAFTQVTQQRLQNIFERHDAQRAQVSAIADDADVGVGQTQCHKDILLRGID